jgi:hypothetical protein
MKHLTVALLCAAPLLYASAAQSATLDITRGEVFVNRGVGFEALRSSSDLSLGDTVVGQPGSVAKITFADGCAVSLDVGTVFRVGKLSPCTLHSAGAGASGVTGTPTTDGWNPQVTSEGANYTPYLLGAVAIGGIAGAAVALGGGGGGGGGGNGNPPASP